jgi:anti-sigma factor RsiW
MAGEDRMSRPDEGLIHAWLDGELSPDEAARVASLSEQDPEWREAVAEARGLIAASSRIVRALDAVPGGVVPARVPVARKPYRVRPWVGIAAGLVFVAGTTYVMRDTTETVFRPTLPTASDVAPTSTPASTPTPPPSDTVPLSAPAPLIDSASRRLRRAAEELREQAKVTAEPAAARVADRTAEQTAAAQRSVVEVDVSDRRSQRSTVREREENLISAGIRDVDGELRLANAAIDEVVVRDATEAECDSRGRRNTKERSRD